VNFGSKDGATTQWGSKEENSKSTTGTGKSGNIGTLDAASYTFTTSTVGGMTYKSTVPGGGSTYSKVVILLHGGGSSEDEGVNYLNTGFFTQSGNVLTTKWIFPRAMVSDPSSSGYLWYDSIKDTVNCPNLDDSCAYVQSTITDNSNGLKALIDQEAAVSGIGHANIVLGGFSQGAQMASYMQLHKLTNALGGVAVMSGYALPPTFTWPALAATAAQAAATCKTACLSSMRWFIWWGATDSIFPADASVQMYKNILSVLGATTALKIERVVADQGH
jgi:predicted esterase